MIKTVPALKKLSFQHKYLLPDGDYFKEEKEKCQEVSRLSVEWGGRAQDSEERLYCRLVRKELGQYLSISEGTSHKSALEEDYFSRKKC